MKRATFAILAAAAVAALAGGAAHAADANPLRLTPDHATASVADLDKESRWYEQVLGFQELSRFQNPAGYTVLQMTIPGYRIDLVSAKASVRRSQGPGALNQGWLHLVFRTPAIDAAYARLTAQGVAVKVLRDAKANITRLTFLDPEGNELEIETP